MPVGPTDDALPTRRRLLQAARGQTWLRSRARRFARDLQAGRSTPPGDGHRIVGVDPVRILLVGGDYSVGLGTASRSEALDGALARLVHERTGRGVIVVNRSREQLRLRDLTGSLGQTGAATFHLVVWTPTFAEASRYLGARRWREEVGRLIRRVRDTSTAGVVLLGIPSLTGITPIALMARARAAQINRGLRGTADTDPRCIYVDAPALHLDELSSTDGAEVYAAAAERIAPAVVHLLGSRTGAAVSRPAARARG